LRVLAARLGVAEARRYARYRLRFGALILAAMPRKLTHASFSTDC